LADLDVFLLLSTLPAALTTREDTVALTVKLDRWLDATATRFDCCLSQPISDGVKGWLTTEILPFDLREALKSVSKTGLPEFLKGFAMSFS